jgi:hypothetical protein
MKEIVIKVLRMGYDEPKGSARAEEGGRIFTFRPRSKKGATCQLAGVAAGRTPEFVEMTWVAAFFIHCGGHGERKR